MSVTGVGRIATAEKMSVEQLKTALENKTLPAYIAYPLIDEKLNMQERIKANAAMRQAQQPQPPIAQGIDQRMAMASGVDALPSNLPTRGMAGGGIVAFEDGGEVVYASNGLPPERFEAASEAVRRARREQLGLDQEGLDDQTRRDRETMLDTLRRMKAAGMDIATLPGRGLAGAFESAVTRPLRAMGVNMPYLPSSFYGGNAASMFPYYDQIRKEDAEKTAAQPTPAAKPDATIPPTATAPAGAPGADKSLVTPEGAAVIPGQGLRLPTPPTGSALQEVQKVMQGEPDKGIAGYLGRSEEREKRLMESIGKDRLQGQAFGEYEKMLKKEGEQAGLDKEQAKYMALLKAGLSMMAGTSRHALENIGKGAMVGAADYQEAYKDLRKAERERNKEFALIEQARRAEQRDDIKRRDELLMRASDAAQRRDDFGTQALMNAGIKDQDRALEAWKTQYAGGVQLSAAQIRANALGARGAGITPYQLSQIRGQAMDRITPDMIRAQLVKELKLSKAPAPGADKKFDERVNEAYEKAIQDFVQKRLGGSAGGGAPQGYSLVGTED